MVATPEPKAKSAHPLSRFVSAEAIALHLQIQPEDIYRIDCWRYVIHVVGKGLSTFVSYADLPPILGVESPTAEDIHCWRKRWKSNKFKAPDFWKEFYAQKFRKAPYLEKLHSWGKLVATIKFGLSEAALEWLRIVYAQEKELCLQSF